MFDLRPVFTFSVLVLRLGYVVRRASGRMRKISGSFVELVASSAGGERQFD